MSQATPTQSRPRLLPAHLALVGAQVMFGLFPVIGMVVFQPGGFSPLGMGAWRITMATLILLPVAFALRGRAAWPAREDLPRFVIGGWFGVALNQALFLEGLARSTPMNVVLVTCMIPVFTFAIAALIGLERFSVIRLAGILVALGGTLPLVLQGGLTSFGQYGRGNLMVATGGFLYSWYLVLSKPLLRRYPPIAVIAWSYTFSLPFVAWFATGQRLVPEPGHALAWWGLVYTILFPTILAYLFNMFALSRIEASTATVYIYAQPLITGLASWAVFGETPTHAMLLAAPALFLGVWLVSRSPAPRVAS